MMAKSACVTRFRRRPAPAETSWARCRSRNGTVRESDVAALLLPATAGARVFGWRAPVWQDRTLPAGNRPGALSAR